MINKGIYNVTIQCFRICCNRPEFFYKMIFGIFFSDLCSGGREKKSSENDQLTGHFWSFFYLQNK